MNSSVIMRFMVKKKSKLINPGKVIIPAGHPNPPEEHEVDVALILASHYQTTVEFFIPVDDYLRKSADVVMLGVLWEIKSPNGNSRSTISNQFKRGSKQSRNLAIDSRRTKMKYDVFEKRVITEYKKRKNVKKVVLINKFGKVVEM